MNLRTRTRTATVVGLALAAPLALAGPAFAQGGGGSPWTCGAPTTRTLAGITSTHTFSVLTAGKVTLTRDATNDGLIVSRVVASTGWSKSVKTRSGPKVSVQFQRDRSKVEFEAAQSAQYYGPDILVTEVKTCHR